VQSIDGWLKELASPSIDSGTKELLEGWVQHNEKSIQQYKDALAECETEMEVESKALFSNQGEPVELLC
jgi:bacterioferritin (cytochrome b1)